MTMTKTLKTGDRVWEKHAGWCKATVYANGLAYLMPENWTRTSATVAVARIKPTACGNWKVTK